MVYIDEIRNQTAGIYDDLVDISNTLTDVSEDLGDVFNDFFQEGMNKNDLAQTGFQLMDIRVDLELTAEVIGELLPKLKQSLDTLVSLDARVRALVPEFQIDYAKYFQQSREDDLVDVDEDEDEDEDEE